VLPLVLERISKVKLGDLEVDLIQVSEKMT